MPSLYTLPVNKRFTDESCPLATVRRAEGSPVEAEKLSLGQSWAAPAICPWRPHQDRALPLLGWPPTSLPTALHPLTPNWPLKARPVRGRNSSAENLPLPGLTREHLKGQKQAWLGSMEFPTHTFNIDRSGARVGGPSPVWESLGVRGQDLGGMGPGQSGGWGSGSPPAQEGQFHF